MIKKRNMQKKWGWLCDEMRKGVKGMEYQCGFVVFMDILGFKNYVCNESRKVDNVFSIFEFSEKIQYLYNTSDLQGVKIGFFSDSFVLTTSEKNASSFSAIMIAAHLINLYVFKNTGLCTRGAVVIGEFYHEKGIVFGPGIVKAYLLENERAKFVRMIVDDDILNIYNNSAMIQKTLDGYYELNWFMLAINDCVENDDYQREKGLELAKKYRETLIELLKKHKDSSVYEKYISLIPLFNKFCYLMDQYKNQGGYLDLVIKDIEMNTFWGTSTINLV